MVAEINWETEQVLYETLRMGLENGTMTREAFEAILKEVRSNSGGNDHILVPYRQLVSQYHPEWLREPAEDKTSATPYQPPKLHISSVSSLRERRSEPESLEYELVRKLARIAEFKSESSFEHVENVGKLSALIALEMGWSVREAEVLRLAAELHDIGKVAIPDSILLKPGKLSLEEYQKVKEHTLIGAEILSGKSELLQVAQKIALSHHERWDGYGFPKRLSGHSIPMAARIVAIADVLDALTRDRPYKKAWSLTESLFEVKHFSGEMFDPEVVEACLRVFAQLDLRFTLSELMGMFEFPLCIEEVKASADSLAIEKSPNSLGYRLLEELQLKSSPAKSASEWFGRN